MAHHLEITVKSGDEIKAITVSHEAVERVAGSMEAAEFGVSMIKQALRNRLFQEFSTSVNQQVEEFISDNITEAD